MPFDCREHQQADGLGSVTSLTDPTGAIAATYTYDSFGFLTNSTGSATNWYRYTARQFDSETAVYYYRSRYYDPVAGRFLNEDPIRFNGGTNFYAYTRNNGVNHADPSGLCPTNNPPNNFPCNLAAGAPDPTVYQGLGQAVQRMLNDPDLNVSGQLQNLLNLASFRHGSSLDAQSYGGGYKAAPYANYVYGVYQSAAGASLADALAGANWYGSHFSTYTFGPDNPQDPNYPALPAKNVAAIIQGYYDQQNGTLCSP